MLRPIFFMICSKQLDAFIERLAEHRPAGAIFNQYATVPTVNAGRRHNLRLYLRQMASHRPSLLLVGEAAGYRGCRLTGVPFTSEQVLRDGAGVGGLFGLAASYRKALETPHGRREATATIVWDALQARKTLPLLWNALPFHPHRPGEPFSNRTPSKVELLTGEPFLRALLALFQIETVVAVGNKAEAALDHWGFASEKIRHPSHGGKQAFNAGLKAVIHKQHHRHPHPACEHLRRPEPDSLRSRPAPRPGC